MGPQLLIRVLVRGVEAVDVAGVVVMMTRAVPLYGGIIVQY
jgi:hypothetical protein